uniref:L-type lectin-like domain-containing protein n=1 Tax=Chromulina nebulosa TaxID=96789 RepID=A0A7S0XEJ2_9STRA
MIIINSTNFLILLLILISINKINGEILSSHSFEPPFENIDSLGGQRIIPNWRAGGTTVINSNFIRITPDRQSKKGALWSRKAINVPAMSSVFKFRISGQGKNFFGDGMAVWIVQNAYYTEGALHGFIDKFVGIGVIFDTFKNTENLAIHRDVTILINDGEKTYEAMTQEVQGCNINVRYHNERADFSVTDMSKARITVDDNHRLQVLVDAKNTGEWTTCVDITDLPLQKDWLKKAYIGITATTGQLADNHDVISLTSYSDYEVMEKVEEEKDNKRLFESFPGKDFDERITRLEETMNDVLSKFNVLDHHIEHEFVAANDHIDNMIAKLNSKEESAETRIEDLETLVKKQVDGSITDRLDKLETQMKGNLDKKINTLETTIDRKLTNKINAKEKLNNNNKSKEPEISTSSCNCSYWPFYLSILVNLGACSWFYYVFYMSKKKHLL